MMDCGHSDRCSFDIDPGADQLLDRTKGTAAEFSCDRVSSRGIFVDHADQFNGLEFTSKLVVNAGVITSEGAYADDGNGNGIVGLQILDFRLKNGKR
jgi:hypothetical protein